MDNIRRRIVGVIFPHEISFYASLKPIATFSLLRHGPVEDSVRSVLRWHRPVKRHRYMDHDTSA